MFEYLDDLFNSEDYKVICIIWGGGGGGEFPKFFKKYFVARGTIELNISWPCNFFKKSFMAPPINFSFSFKA